VLKITFIQIGSIYLISHLDNVIETFNKFGSLIVDWPYKEDTNSAVPPKGFAFLLFEVRTSNDINLVGPLV